MRKKNEKMRRGKSSQTPRKEEKETMRITRLRHIEARERDGRRKRREAAAAAAAAERRKKPQVDPFQQIMFSSK